jgi:hypothetical protein
MTTAYIPTLIANESMLQLGNIFLDIAAIGKRNARRVMMRNCGRRWMAGSHGTIINRRKEKKRLYILCGRQES